MKVLGWGGESELGMCAYFLECSTREVTSNQ